MSGSQKVNEFTPISKVTIDDVMYALRSGATDFSVSLRAAIMEAAEAFADYGLLMTWVSTTSFSVGPGVRGDSTRVEGIRITATTTKTTAAWAAGTGVGGLDTGAIAANTWYYVYVIKHLSSGYPDPDLTDVLFSTSASAPTMPAGYTLKRMIGAVKTNASSQFIQFIGYEDGRQAWPGLFADVNTTTLSSAKASFALNSVPPIRTSIELIASMVNASPVSLCLYGDTNMTDAAPNADATGINTVMTNAVGGVSVRGTFNFVCAAGSIFARSSAASTTLIAQARSFNVRPFN